MKQKSTPDNVEFSIMLEKLQDTLRSLESFQMKNAEHVFNTGSLQVRTAIPCSAAYTNA
ncbi:hypothetical protein L195_g043650 [Trifolium pratense]|uniref:Uncharacterized protein n=1 Tax=Trifolium pratense TaxID=57577 RepID=A0A2K3M9W5_TRIPR|nr:hypothetical protein L195_g043650 [Trifolium pratense]